jgi:hypothetical protein
MRYIVLISAILWLVIAWSLGVGEILVALWGLLGASAEIDAGMVGPAEFEDSAIRLPVADSSLESPPKG